MFSLRPVASACCLYNFFFQAEDGIRDLTVTGVQTCALPICCPRTALQRQIERAATLGFTMRVGCEVEFFIFEQGEGGEPTTRTLDAGSYFDLVPVDRGERARRVIVTALEEMKLSSEASHHEVARGQHEIDLGYAEPLTMADQLATLRFVVRTVAVRHGLVATFMPKPIYGRNGSGMHTHQSLFAKGKNAFVDAKGPVQLSEVGRWYIGGLLRHARGYCAVTNPLVNSDRKSTRLNSSHSQISYAVFCLKKKKKNKTYTIDAHL